MLSSNQISHLLNDYSNRVVGKRAVLKAVASGEIKCVVLADDVDVEMLNEITAFCRDNGVKVYQSESKRELGKLAGIEVACACIGLF